MKLVLDIETIPAATPTIEDIREKLEAGGFTPPGNVTKAETIAEKERQWRETLPAQAEEQWRKTALSATKGGRILCIGYRAMGIPHDDVKDLGKHVCGCFGWEEEEDCFHLDEYRTLKEFWHFVRPRANDPTFSVIGHNVLNFDLPYIYQRSVVNRVKPTHELDMRRYQQHPVFDTMQVWTGWNSQEHASLDTLCKLLDIPTPKDGIDGSKVWDAVAAGEHRRVRDYCLADVEATYAVYRRMNYMEDI